MFSSLELLAGTTRLEALSIAGIYESMGDRSRYFGDRGYEALCRSRAFVGLRAFAHGGAHRASAAAGGLIFQAPWFGGGAPLEPALFAAAARAGALDALEELRVDSAAAAEVLLDSELPRLRSLEILDAVRARLAARWGTIVETDYVFNRWSPKVVVK